MKLEHVQIGQRIRINMPGVGITGKWEPLSGCEQTGASFTLIGIRVHNT